MYRLFSGFLLLFFLWPSVINARSLYWQDVDVKANLDASGRLHIREQQTIVFSGKWNGGERKFLVRPGQKMQFKSISRIASDGKNIPLIRGNLGVVDHWNHNGKTSIRWRSRLPSDPAFNKTPMTYVLQYSLGNILHAEAEKYLLNHDFCFPDRSGIIKNFRLHLQFDPVWYADPVSVVRHNIPPGQGVILRQLLNFSGDIKPGIYTPPPNISARSIRPPAKSAPVWLLSLLFAVLFVFISWRIRGFFRWESGLSRFVSIVEPETIDLQWLEQEIFVYKPEVVGATWDKSTSTAEVAAVLARLVQEGRMKSWLKPYRLPFFNLKIPGIPPVLYLELLEKRETFSGYEYKLIKGLFVDGSTITDTKTIREHYRSKRKTFDPVNKLKEPLKKQMEKLTRDGLLSPGHSWLPTALVAVVGFFLLLINVFYHQDEFAPLQIVGMSFIFFCWIVGVINASNYRRSVVYLGWLLAGLFFSIFLLLTGFALFYLFPASTLLLTGLFCMAVAAANNMINLARSRESKKGLALRRRLAAARNYFAKELRQEKPDIRDEWFPYLLAFGLGQNVDSWFRQHGGNVSHFQITGTGSVGSGNSHGFSGGGGAFGGGGASGSWSAAVGSFTTSTSSSSSGGGSGGGSSGGGGGGGW